MKPTPPARPLTGAADDAIAELDDVSRQHAAETNLRRAGLELQGAAAFNAVTQALIGLRAAAPIVGLCADAVAEELRHAEIYAALASAYAGSEVERPRPAPIDVPRYPSAGADGERLLQVVGMCCVNETMACAFLQLCFAHATAPFARAGVREVLEDEVRHARVGWAYLGCDDVGPAERRLISSFLPSILENQWTHWSEHIDRLPEIDLAAHGCPPPSAIRTAAMASIGDLVLPGFRRAGIEASDAERWIDAVEARLRG